MIKVIKKAFSITARLVLWPVASFMCVFIYLSDGMILAKDRKTWWKMYLQEILSMWAAPTKKEFWK